MRRFKTLDAVFQALKEHFRPEMAQGVQAVVAVHVDGNHGGSWYLRFANGRMDVLREPPGEPIDVEVRTSEEDYWALLYGEMDPVGAYMRGRLRIKGDLRLLYQLQYLFRLPDTMES